LTSSIATVKAMQQDIELVVVNENLRKIKNMKIEIIVCGRIDRSPCLDGW